MNIKKMKAFMALFCASLIVFSCLTILNAVDPSCSARSSCGAHCENYGCNEGRCWSYTGGARCICDNITIDAKCGEDNVEVYIQ